MLAPSSVVNGRKKRKKGEEKWKRDAPGHAVIMLDFGGGEKKGKYVGEKKGTRCLLSCGPWCKPSWGKKKGGRTIGSVHLAL